MARMEWMAEGEAGPRVGGVCGGFCRGSRREAAPTGSERAGRGSAERHGGGVFETITKLAAQRYRPCGMTAWQFARGKLRGELQCRFEFTPAFEAIAFANAPRKLKVRGEPARIDDA